jgi:hypothetical protein
MQKPFQIRCPIKKKLFRNNYQGEDIYTAATYTNGSWSYDKEFVPRVLENQKFGGRAVVIGNGTGRLKFDLNHLKKNKVQTYGCNAINGGITDGLNSSLINQQNWELGYCYYYVDVSRMLPVEQQVPKSVQVIGQNSSVRSLDLWCFLAYGCEISIDILSGSRL